MLRLRLDTPNVHGFLRFLALLLLVARLDAATFQLDGDLSYQITEPRCTFLLNGDLTNTWPSTTVSGTLKLVLWATVAPYPSAGKIVAEQVLGELRGGDSFRDFSVRTTPAMPVVTGKLYFTMTLVEFTGTAWRAVLVEPMGTRELKDGHFASAQKWPLPDAPVIDPPLSLAVGQTVKLTLQASSLLYRFPQSLSTEQALELHTNRKIIATDSAGKAPAIYRYAVKRSKYLDKEVQVGKLNVDFSAVGDDGKDAVFGINLYFQTATSGVYKSHETGDGFTETTWGLFTIG